MEKIKKLFDIEKIEPIPGHEGGRNTVYSCGRGVLRLSDGADRGLEDFLAETEFVHYLAANGAPVADALPSKAGNFVEAVEHQGRTVYASLFTRAPGMLIADNGYRYREGAPLSEYFHNTGKALGKIHRLSKLYVPEYRRAEYFDKYNMDYINGLIPDEYAQLKEAIAARLAGFRELPQDGESYGLVHFDFSDGNYHVDMETGDITAFDFDNCMYCWYMFDLANLWVHGWGWCMAEQDMERRRAIMDGYFAAILEGYRAETDVAEEMLEKLPLFIDMVLIENIVDEFECAQREREEIDPEDIEDAAECLVEGIPYAGYFEN